MVHHLLYTPTERQRAFHLCPAKYPLYGGAAGGGKSHGLRWHLFMACLASPGVSALLLCRHPNDAVRIHKRALLDAAGDAVWQDTGPIGVLGFPNGSTLELNHWSDAVADAPICLTQYSIIGLDELVDFTESQFITIQSLAKQPDGRVLSTTRPSIDPKAAWVRRRWIDRHDDECEAKNDYVYIHATMRDNPYLVSAGMYDSLEAFV